MYNIKFVNHRLIVSVILIFLIFTSCSKSFLDQTPYTSVSPENALKSENDALIALRGVYADLRDVNLFGRTISVFGDLYADNAYISIKNSGKYLAFDNYTISANNGDFSGIWSMSYNAILRANNIINATLIDNDNVKQYKGEAYALRALMYFYLVRIYATPYLANSSSMGVPIVLTYNPGLKPSRNTVAENYTQIISDLDNAILLQNQYLGSARFSKFAAMALESKVYLYMGQYQKALDLSNNIITNSGFAFLKGPDLLAYWGNPAFNPPSYKKETLFEVDADATLNISFNELACIYNQGSTGDLLANENLYALYGPSDYRKGLLQVGPRPQGELSAVLVQKYKNYTGDVDNKKVLRLSEMYLIAAECYNRLNDDVSAKAILNEFMAQRDPTLIYTDSGNNLLNDIITERRKEFAFEGDRYFDYNRLRLDMNRTGGNYTVRQLPFGDYRRIAPIPQGEINANPNIASQQNVGY